MKNYLKLLKSILIKQNKEDLDKEQNTFDINRDTILDDKVQEFINSLKIKFDKMELEEINKEYINAFVIRNNLIFFYPQNDGMPRCPFEFFNNGKLIIDNRTNFIAISNLDEILLTMVRIINKGLDEDIIINPFSFMLELTGDITNSYHGRANLVMTDKTIKNNSIQESDFIDAKTYYINVFLDNFIGWNFGLSVNRCSKLREELISLNEKVISLGIREDFGQGFEVYGTTDEVYNGLQHFKLPTTLDKEKKLRIIK